MFKNLGSIFIIYLMIGTVSLLDLPFVSDIQDMIGLAHDVGDIAAGNVPLKGFFVATVNPINVIMDTVTQLVDQVTNLGNELNGKLDSVLSAVLIRVPLEGKIDDDMKEIINYMSKIDRKYDDFEIYSEFPEDYAEETLRNHINYVIGTNTGDLQDLLHSMLNIIVPPKSVLQRASLLENIKYLRNISDTKELCDLDLSFQYRLYKIYNILMITELKAFIMTQFAYKQLKELNSKKVNSIYQVVTVAAYIGEMRRAQVKYIMRAYETHYEFERLFSSYVINEYQVSNCQGGCSDRHWINNHPLSYNFKVSSAWASAWYSFKIINGCQGLLLHCGWIGGQVDICQNNEGARKRFQYVRSRVNGYYGKWTRCEGANYQSIYSFAHNAFDCDNCMCTCFENKAESTAVRAIDLRPQVSNIEENKVLSNIRFVLKDRMMHMQIEEAPLLPVGHLDTNHTEWVPLGDFEYFSNISDSGGFMLRNEDGDYEELTEDVDYAFINYDRRRFNLDEVSTSPRYVVTGVKWGFESFSDKKNSHYQLEVHVTPFNFTSGQLAPTDDNPSIWLTAATQPIIPVEYLQERAEQKNGFKVDFDDTGNFNPIPMKNKFVILERSDKHDGAQYTVPFFDARATVTTQNLAFDGIGHVFHESNKEHAGIIALKMMTIDMTLYVKPELKNSQLKFYKKLYREPLRYNPPKMK